MVRKQLLTAACKDYSTLQITSPLNLNMMDSDRSLENQRIHSKYPNSRFSGRILLSHKMDLSTITINAKMIETASSWGAKTLEHFVTTLSFKHGDIIQTTVTSSK